MFTSLRERQRRESGLDAVALEVEIGFVVGELMNKLSTIDADHAIGPHLDARRSSLGELICRPTFPATGRGKGEERSCARWAETMRMGWFNASVASYRVMR